MTGLVLTTVWVVTTMMFSDLATAWPPAAGPTQGYKHESTRISADEEYPFSLQRLHAGAWWTGFYVATTEPDVEIQVVMRRAAGAVAFDVAADQCKWTQQSGTWCHFPWPIPAAMADMMGLYIDVSVSATTHISMRASFHELSGLSVNDRYLFIAGDGVPVHHWDGAQNAWGNPVTGFNPAWTLAHTVVPTMAQLLATGEWNDNKLFAINDWNEIVPPA